MSSGILSNMKQQNAFEEMKNRSEITQEQTLNLQQRKISASSAENNKDERDMYEGREQEQRKPSRKKIGKEQGKRLQVCHGYWAASRDRGTETLTVRSCLRP